MIKITDLTQFDIEAILHSGQVFRYFEIENGYLVLSREHWAKVILFSDRIEIESDDEKYFSHYFDLETNYQTIKSKLNFPKLQNALKVGGGIRILHGDFVEMVITFIISANNNIKRFTKTLNVLCAEYGNPIQFGQFAFPTLAQLSKISTADFRRLGCGYRDQYLVKAIQQLQTINFDQLNRLSTPDLRHELLKIAGVGPKVAACIMLFAFHRLEVVPVDTWIKKALAQLSSDEQQQILTGQYAGVAQQYIFYYLQYLQRETL